MKVQAAERPMAIPAIPDTQNLIFSAKVYGLDTV
jgi:hypothetical protein